MLQGQYPTYTHQMWSFPGSFIPGLEDYNSYNAAPIKLTS